MQDSNNKLVKLQELMAVISVYKGAVTPEAKAKEAELMDRLEFRQKELQEEFKERSLDIKIKVFENLLLTLKKDVKPRNNKKT